MHFGSLLILSSLHTRSKVRKTGVAADQIAKLFSQHFYSKLFEPVKKSKTPTLISILVYTVQCNKKVQLL